MNSRLKAYGHGYGACAGERQRPFPATLRRLADALVRTDEA